MRAKALIAAADVAVLRAAERAGNLPWASGNWPRATAAGFTYRLFVFLQVAFPLVILTVSLAIGLFVAAYFMPLIA